MTFVFVNGSYHGLVPFHGRITFLVPGHYINELAADLEMQGDSFEMFGHLSKAKFWRTSQKDHPGVLGGSSQLGYVVNHHG